MKRGIIVLSKDELKELVKYFNIYTSNTQLQIKIKAAYENIQHKNSILVSDEELESILDEIGIVDNSNTLLKEVTDNISKTLITLRNSGY